MDILARVDPSGLGARLKAARSNARLTQGQAAQHIDIARTTLVAIERGDRRVSPTELIALADCYAITPDRLLHEEIAPINISPQFRRIHDNIDDSDTSDTIRALEEMAVRYVDLERKLGRALMPGYPAPAQIKPGNLRNQAEDIALQLRSYLGIGLSPIQDLPSLLEIEMSIRVFLVPLPSKVSGAYVYADRINACVLINVNHSVTRQAWTGAHELGHFMINRQGADIFRENESADATEERFADAFAGAFLMPAAAVRRRHDDSLDANGAFSARALIFLADQFHVSLEAMCRRLESLELLAKGTWDKLKQQGLNAKVACEVLGQRPHNQRSPIQSRFIHIALEAYERDYLSEGELASLLRRDRIQVRELIDQLHEADEIFTANNDVGGEAVSA
jgi:Zn-dependent peptidase ImmA (M78 family)/DNA-binding XRE family transcriptional regulator